MNLIINNTYLGGITSFCGTGICSFYFSHAEVHQKKLRIGRLVLQFLDWHFGQLLTVLSCRRAISLSSAVLVLPKLLEALCSPTY